MDQEVFSQLTNNFENSYLGTRNYAENLRLHRKPMEVRTAILHEVNDDIVRFQSIPALIDIDPANRSQGHATTKINEIWRADRRLKNLYQAVQIYCARRSRDIIELAPLIAEYRAMNRVYNRVQHSISASKKKKMAKKFDLERRETFDKPYLKVHLQGDADFESISKILRSLPAVKKANVTDQTSGKRDLTVYPQKAYDMSDLEKEVAEALTNYFNGNPIDPSFKKQPISGMSDKAYFEILDHILIMGKNLETSVRMKDAFDEEGYRDYIAAHLNSISEQVSAKGEVYNKQGKTDILVFDHDGNNILIAECKLWKGETALLKAADQILSNYVNWRDEKCALIVFNQDVQNFTGMIQTATTALQKHPLFAKFLGNRKDTSFSYVFQHPEDRGKTIKLELILFNFAV